MEGDEFSIPNEDYETQFFGFSPTDVFEGVKELIKDRFEYTLDKLEQQMKKVPQEILPEQELSEGILKLRSITNENINNTLFKLKEHLLQNIMKIPPDLLLPEDAEQAVQYSDEQERLLREEIEELKMQLKVEKYMESALADELKDIEMVLEAQKRELETEFSPSNQNLLEEMREKLAFLLANANEVEKLFHSLQKKNDSSDWEKAFNETFESNALH